MDEPLPAEPFPFNSHATYLIRVMGNLDKRWLDYFDEISIMVTETPDNSYVSTICVHDSDQALLMGILNSLYDYQFPIVSLQCLNYPIAA